MVGGVLPEGSFGGDFGCLLRGICTSNTQAGQSTVRSVPVAIRACRLWCGNVRFGAVDGVKKMAPSHGRAGTSAYPNTTSGSDRWAFGWPLDMPACFDPSHCGSHPGAIRRISES